MNIGLLDAMCRHALNAGYHVILEGILARSRYGEMLQALFHDHGGTSHGYYLDVSLEETLHRHRTDSPERGSRDRRSDTPVSSRAGDGGPAPKGWRRFRPRRSR
ncbi:hypothetical protein ABZ815_12015 [Nonomuraea sp. NPDC047529]|uniref:hypothetical protein n=1 Tax=Nonomuraea sp. NPDC047529 TaxID=3155623 RepID=UPI003410C8E0